MMTIPRTVSALGFGAVLLGTIALAGRAAPPAPSEPVAGSIPVMRVAAVPSPPASPQTAPASARHIDAVDAALANRDISAAVRAWHDAYSVALVSPGWEPFVDVGDAFVRIGDAAGTRDASKANARQVYMSALRRAQRANDAAGLLGVAHAFARLGDDAVAMHSGVLAERVATATGDAASVETARRFLTRYDEYAVVAAVGRF